MQHFAPAFLVVCVFLCLSFSCTFPLHRAHPNDLTGLLNRSRKCGGAGRAKKMSSDMQVIPSQEFPEFENSEVKRKLTGEDLRQYEQLVIMKKYPYLDMKEFEIKFGPAVKNAKYRDAEIAEASDCKLIDDGPRVEIFSRGISGFAIPEVPKGKGAKSPQAPGARIINKNINFRENSRVWNIRKDNERNDLY
ncbi:uncharacterized protein LOC125234543 [Leguminivora glycinivorella]|uniref:uncharacterized protein LOC125234543 n=1 Tax=Leguminivora glycinivorella TaxID=1035111 RepID=UPI00200CFC02|nr:uncharacterized protein LOC125234543 [Leguminivora glycinivorella]